MRSREQREAAEVLRALRPGRDRQEHRHRSRKPDDTPAHHRRLALTITRLGTDRVVSDVQRRGKVFGKRARRRRKRIVVCTATPPAVSASTNQNPNSRDQIERFAAHARRLRCFTIPPYSMLWWRPLRRFVPPHWLVSVIRTLSGILLSIFALASMAGANDASAHPHVWVTVKSELVYGANGTVTAVRHHWTFDEMFSTFATQGLDTDKDGKLSRDELKGLAEVNVTSLKEFDYFTYANGDGKRPHSTMPPNIGWSIRMAAS